MIENFYESFPDEQSYKIYMASLKWSKEVKCPFCNSISNTRVFENFRYHCNKCNTNHSLTTNTIMHDTKIETRKWFMSIHSMLLHENLSYRKLAKIIEVDKKTAYRILKQLNSLYQKNKLEVLRISGLNKAVLEILTLTLLIDVKQRRYHFG